MANPNFTPSLSSNEIWRDLDDTRCITDDLDAIEEDISELQTGKADNNHAHSGYAETNHTHEYAPTSHSHSYNELSDKPTIPAIPDFLPANGGDADTVDGKHASDLALVNHNHDSNYIPKSLQCTDNNGAPEVMVYKADNISLISTLENLSLGIHSVYTQGGVEGNPPTSDSCRCIVHKTNSNIMWVLAFGTSGSIYSNYWNGGTWRGWREIYSATPNALWSGHYYMSDVQTVTPSKTLSECRNGWLLVWSDYDSDTGTVNDEDFVTSIIHKRKPGGTTWTGQSHYFDIPRFIGSTNTDVTGESRIMKRVYVYDDKLVGHVANQYNPRNDVVLRAVYEF